MKRPGTARWLAVAAATVLMAGACVSSGEDSSPERDADDSGDSGAAAPTGDAAFDELVAAAQEEGTLTFYGAPNENALQALADEFEAEYGITAEFLRMSSADLAPRFLSEAEAGTFSADVLLSTDSPQDADSFFHTALGDGYVVDLADAEIPGFPWDFPEEWLRGSRAVVSLLPWLFAYNTDIVDEPPEDWEDLLDPRFQDLILMGDLSSLASVQVWTAVLDEYGEEWFETFREQNPLPYPSAAPAAEALAAGEGGVAVPSVGTLVTGAQERGAPLDLVIPEVTTGVENAVGLVDPERSPHPNAAKLFVAYAMSEAGGAALNGFEAAYSVFDTDSLPAGYVSPPEHAEETRQQLSDLLGIPAG